MKCKTCGTALTPWSSGDCGRHPAPRPVRIVTHSPWVKRALTSNLPATDRTGNIITVKG